MSKTDWLKLNHDMPDGWEKYVTMLAEACSADNELKLLSRFQKVVRLIHDEQCTKTAEVEINNPTLCRIGQGKPVDYDTGKKLETFLGDFKEPRQWELVSSYKKGHLYFGVISGPSPAAGKTIKVREILSQPTKSAVKVDAPK